VSSLVSFLSLFGLSSGGQEGRKESSLRTIGEGGVSEGEGVLDGACRGREGEGLGVSDGRDERRGRSR